MNRVGFCSTKWKGWINERKAIIRQRVDDPENDNNIKKIMNRLHVRKAARNNQQYCAMMMLGHCTKAFTTIRELVKYVNSTYGPH